MSPGMRLTLLSTLALAGAALAQPVAPNTNPAAEAALEHLLSERGPSKALQGAIERARKAGVTEQAILEARFLYHVDQLEDAAIAAMLPDFLERARKFKLEDSAIFAVEEDWLSVVEYVKAIHALDKGDREGFKRHIQEAFWLGPRQAAAFAPHIERLRHEEAMRSIEFDFNIRLATLHGAPPVALSDLLENRKALLLHFWSPHSRECEMSLPDFARTAKMLTGHGMAVISLCAARSPEATTLIQPYRDASHGQWLVDGDDTSLGRLLRVQGLPTMALIDPQGRVLFCGDPADLQFWRALRKLDATIERPESDGHFED